MPPPLFCSRQTRTPGRSFRSTRGETKASRPRPAHSPGNGRRRRRRTWSMWCRTPSSTCPIHLGSDPRRREVRGRDQLGLRFPGRSLEGLLRLGGLADHHDLHAEGDPPQQHVLLARARDQRARRGRRLERGPSFVKTFSNYPLLDELGIKNLRMRDTGDPGTDFDLGTPGYQTQLPIIACGSHSRRLELSGEACGAGCGCRHGPL